MHRIGTEKAMKGEENASPDSTHREKRRAWERSSTENEERSAREGTETDPLSQLRPEAILYYFLYIIKESKLYF